MYKAIICLATENLWLNPEGAYEGNDPDTYQDHGEVNCLKAATIEELKTKIAAKLVPLDQWEEIEGRLQWNCDGEHDYRTPREERIPFTEMWTIVLVEEIVKPLDAKQLLKGAK